MIPKLKLPVVFIQCAVVLLAALMSHAQITPAQDAYTNSATPTTNFGTATTLGVANTSTSIQNAYIQFDLSSIPTGYTGSNVAKATLKLYVNAVTTAGSFNVDFVNGNWSGKTITYNLAPALGSTIVSSVSLPTADKSSYFAIDVTSALQAWLNGTQANDGIALVANGPLNASFDSNENTAQSHPPELDVVFSGAITGINTASGSGLSGGGTSGTLSLGLLKTCTSGQTLAWNGSAWACKTIGGTGTVTKVALAAPTSDFVVTGSPITTSGTLNIAWTVPPDSNNTAGAIVKRDSTGSFLANNFTASGQITVNNGSSLNPIISQASAANAAAIVGFSKGTGLTDGVLGSSVSPGLGSSGVIGIDQNSNGSFLNYTAGVTGVTQNSYGVGVLGYGVLSTNGASGLGFYRVGVWGDDSTGVGVVATSDTGVAATAVNASSNTVYPTLLAQNNTTASNGVIFRAAAPNVQSNSSSAFCQVTTHGDMGCTGDVYQNSPANGLVKALLFFDPAQPAGSQIVRCFNSAIVEPGASTPPCGFTYNHLDVGINQIDFGFTVINRFPQITAGIEVGNNGVSGMFYFPVGGASSQLQVWTILGVDNNRIDAPFSLSIF